MEVPSAADMHVIRQQYRRLAGRYHPDRFHTSTERDQATEQFQAIAEAFALLRAEARQNRRAAARASSESAPRAKTSTVVDGRIPIWWDPVQVELSGSAAQGLRDAARVSGLGTAEGPSFTADILSSWLLFPLLVPAIIARKLSVAIVAAFRHGLALPDFLANLLGTLSGHLLPGLLGLEVGRTLINGSDRRGLLAIAYGLWWVVSAALALALDRIA
ncbi:MAG TPA: J domain-containing protein [Gemmatimonadaceae bacterium]|nr:J domain-containing protein [Gemmatimonadaceae bacterium]